MSTSDRIAKLFSNCKADHRAAFVAYVCACDPDFNRSLDVCKTLIDQGVDLLELGVPFSDPLADGLTNQLAAQRALESGCTQEDVFRLVKEIRKFSQIPIVFYTYYNLVFSQGVQNYVERAKEVGVDGLLTLDLPPEEAEELLEASQELAMRNIFIVAPTTPKSRIPVITK
ncbi:MAG: tryptophan synthase subunit alpha, partial [Opitutae bacterium]|nr:tryptophan synthase subunit alpha [Opitutae bacterium]